MVLASLPSLLSTLAGLARFSAAIMFVSALLVALAGWAHLRGVRRREADRTYTRDRQLRQLLRVDRRFAQRWIGCGVALTGTVLLFDAPLAIALLGAFTTLFTFVNGISIARRIVARKAALEPALVRHRGHKGSGRRLIAPGRLLLAAAIAAAVFAGVAAGEIVVSERSKDVPAPKKQRKLRSGSDAAEGSTGAREDVFIGPPTYAELCPQLPDPLKIGHGLGELFRRVAAIKAGCGEIEQSVAGLHSVWFSRGVCGDRLQSLAVASPDYTPVMLFGEAASFALEAAESGELIFADVAEPAAGEVAAIGTASGTYFFARPSPSRTSDGEEAIRCSDLEGSARPFVLLAPAPATRWLCQLEQSGWAWPIAGEGESEIVFQDFETGALVASEECEGMGECEVAGEGCEVPLPVTLAQLRLYMPPRIVG